jgi:hypothetical protein
MREDMAGTVKVADVSCGSKISEGAEQVHSLYFSVYEKIDRLSPPRSVAVFQIAGC